MTEDLSPLLADGDVTDGRGDAAGAVQATSVEHDSLLVAGLLLAITGTVLFAPGYSRHLARWRSDPVVLSGLGMTRRRRWTGGTLPAVGVAALSVPIAVVVGAVGSLVLPLGAARRAEAGRSIRIDVPVTVAGLPRDGPRGRRGGGCRRLALEPGHAPGDAASRRRGHAGRGGAGRAARARDRDPLRARPQPGPGPTAGRSHDGRGDRRRGAGRGSTGRRRQHVGPAGVAGEVRGRLAPRGGPAARRGRGSGRRTATGGRRRG